jgi:hypothetical protein
MIDQLAIFAAEVTRVAREVGTEGKLGVQAEVGNIEGTWQEITYVLVHPQGKDEADEQVQCQHDGVQFDHPSTSVRPDLCSRYRRRLYPIHYRLCIRRDGLAQDENQSNGVQSSRKYREEYGSQTTGRNGKQE